MRDSINGVWVLGIVMVFMAIFIAYVAISINYSTAYTLKSKIVTISKIDAVIRDNAYYNKFTCRPAEGIADTRVFGITDMNATLNPTTPQSYCVTRDYRNATDGTETQYYYTVTLAFAFDLPILGNILNFRVSGETNGLLYPNDTLFD